MIYIGQIAGSDISKIGYDKKVSQNFALFDNIIVDKSVIKVFRFEKDSLLAGFHLLQFTAFAQSMDNIIRKITIF